MLKYFFDNWHDIPKEYHWQAYTSEYFIWIVFLILLMIMICHFYKESKDRDKFRKIFACLIILQEIIKDLLHIRVGTFHIELLPVHLCGVSIFMILWHAYKPNKLNTEYLYCLALPGGLIALCFPDWTHYPILHFQSVHSFLLHAWLIIYPLMQIYTKELKPNVKNLKYPFIFIVIYMIPVYIFNKIFDTNFLFLNNPTSDAPIAFLYHIFGYGYIPVMILIFSLLWIPMYIPWIIINKRSQYL